MWCCVSIWITGLFHYSEFVSVSPLCSSQAGTMLSQLYCSLAPSTNTSSTKGQFFWFSKQNNEIVFCMSDLKLWYDVILEFNIDWKAECGQLSLAHVTKITKYTKSHWNKQMPVLVLTKSGPSPRSVKAVYMEPERLWLKWFCEADVF